MGGGIGIVDLVTDLRKGRRFGFYCYSSDRGFVPSYLEIGF